MNEDTKHSDKQPGDSPANENENGADEPELDDVFFPVTVVTKTIVQNDAEDKQRQEEFIDEDAIVRCFDMSVNAHVQKTQVHRYGPLTSHKKQDGEM